MAMKKIVCALLAFCLLIVLLYRPGLLFSCGPFSMRAVFTYATHPDLPLEKFVRGELGVLQSSYEWPALYVAYRHLTGMGFNQEEQKAVLALWKTRLGLQGTFPVGESVRDWLDTRNKVPGAPSVPEPSAYRSAYRSVESYYVSYLNCPDAAFRTAASTLTQRIAQFGADSPAVQDWLVAQDQVFANCPGGHTIPTTASPALPLQNGERSLLSMGFFVWPSPGRKGNRTIHAFPKLSTEQ